MDNNFNRRLLRRFVAGPKNRPIVIKMFCCSRAARQTTKPVLTEALLAKSGPVLKVPLTLM